MLGVFNSSTIPALEQTISFAQKRHAVLAGNIANLDTPGYRARDLSTEDFQAALARAIDPESVSPGELPANAATPTQAMQHLVFHDDSDVNLEHQVTQIAKNQHMHNTAIAIMRSQFSQLQVAISERA